MKKYWDYVLIGGLSTFIILFVFKIFNIDISIPLNFVGDAVQPYNFAKNIIDSGWWNKGTQFGAPGVQELYDYPLTDTIHFLLIKLLIVIGFDWIGAINYFYILTFPLTAMIAYYVLQKMEVKRYIGIPISIIYAFVPYHLFRGVDHLFISSYYAMPLGILVAYYFATKKIPKFIELLVLGLIIGSMGAYYTYFSLVLITVGLIFGISTKFDKNLIYKYLFFALIVGATFFANLYPSISYSVKYGKNLNTTTRLPSQSEKFGLRIIQLVLPIEDHNISVLNKVTKKYVIYAPADSINENQFAALGLVGTAGFLFLLATLIINTKSRENLKILSVFNIFCVLLGTVGGLGTIFSVYINPVYRSINRVSIVISFLSLATVSLVLQKIKLNKTLVTVLAWLILGVSLYDQISIGTMRNFRNHKKYFDPIKTFTQNIEKELGKDASVFTLPYGEYPEGGEKNTMQLAIVSENLKWSTGAGKGRLTSKWQYEVSQKETATFLQEIIERGFTGLLIKAETNTQEKIQEINTYLGQPTLNFYDKYIFYNLNGYKTANEIEIKTPDVEYYISGNCIKNDKYWCVDTAYIIVENYTDNKLSKTFDIDIEHANKSREVIEINESLKPGTNKIEVKSETQGVFEKPFNEIPWPSTLDYPNFKIFGVTIK